MPRTGKYEYCLKRSSSLRTCWVGVEVLANTADKIYEMHVRLAVSEVSQEATGQIIKLQLTVTILVTNSSSGSFVFRR